MQLTHNEYLMSKLPEVIKALEVDGFYVFRNYISKEHAIDFRCTCERLLTEVPWYSSKRYVKNETLDYAIKWLYSRDKKDLASIRLMLFEHNMQEDVVRSIIDSVSAYKKALDEHWAETMDFYTKSEMDFMCIVSRYENDTGYYPKHRDAPVSIKSPLPQAQMLLSDPGTDFNDGELLLHLDNGQTLSSGDLGLEMGDLFIFDKRIEHSVTQVHASQSSVGRWMALFGVSVKHTPPLSE